MAFRVIEGAVSEPNDFGVEMAAQAIRYLTIELLRSLARGTDSKRRITEQLIELYKHLGKPGIMVDTVGEYIHWRGVFRSHESRDE